MNQPPTGQCAWCGQIKPLEVTAYEGEIKPENLCGKICHDCWWKSIDGRFQGATNWLLHGVKAWPKDAAMPPLNVTR